MLCDCACALCCMVTTMSRWRSLGAHHSTHLCARSHLYCLWDGGDRMETDGGGQSQSSFLPPPSPFADCDCVTVASQIRRFAHSSPPYLLQLFGSFLLSLTAN